jgi:glycosyltransferase involved in cell wall biosynthesis
MLHFFPAWSKDAAGTPLGAELRRLAVPHKFFGDEINQRYTNALGLVFRVYPRVIGFAIKSAFRSLVCSSPTPTAVVIGTDVEALIFWAVRTIWRRHALIVYQSFILTPKASALKNRFHRLYFGLVVSAIDLAICHSNLEVERNARDFSQSRRKFIFVPFGTTVGDRHAIMAQQRGDRPYIVSAGRAGRDYHTLAAAIATLPCDLDILCDLDAPVTGIQSDRIRVIKDCFGRAYLEALANSLFVVVPISVAEISAGQMVLLAAAALGKAVIITRTATTCEYATDGEDAIFVDIGDVAQMRDAIQRLLNDTTLRKRIGDNAALRFERDHSTEAYVRKLVAAISAPTTR